MIAPSKNALALTGNFNSPTAVVTRRAPSSPMVVQSLVEAIANLTEQVTALTVRQAQQPQIVHVPMALPKRSESIETDEDDFNMDLEDDSPPLPQNNVKVTRNRPKGFFD